MKRTRKLGTAVLVAASLVAGVLALGPVGSLASSHREAPLIADDPAVDGTDFYMFRSPLSDPGANDTINLIANFYPFENPSGGPNFFTFDDDARYDFNIDNDHDAQADLIYRFTFDSSYQAPGTFLYNTGPVTTLTDADLNYRQTYDLKRVRVGGNTKVLIDDAPVVPSNVGTASMPDYENDLFEAGVETFGSGPQQQKAFAGQSDDPFFLDLRVFDLLYGTNFSEIGNDTLAGLNTQVLALQVTQDSVAQNGDADAYPIIGGWSTVSRPGTTVQKANGNQKVSGSHVQISRLANPLVNEVVIPVGDKDKWNGSKPADDGQFATYVTNPLLPPVIEAVYSIPAPATPRNDLVQVFLTGVPTLNMPANVTPSEQMRLNMSIAPNDASCSSYSRLGVIGGDNCGYPNGRRLADDTIDISLQVVEGELVGNPNTLGDSVNTNDVPFEGTFPYVAVPHSGSDT